jgi:hypothetical protein
MSVFGALALPLNGVLPVMEGFSGSYGYNMSHSGFWGGSFFYPSGFAAPPKSTPGHVVHARAYGGNGRP